MITALDSSVVWAIIKSYRKAGGLREHLVPDFVIAAHARIQANGLAAMDRGHLRTWFAELELLTV